MVDLSAALEALPTVFTGGAGIGAGIFFLRWLFEWIGARVDKKEAVVASEAAQLHEATKVLIEHLQAQITALTERNGAISSRLDTVEAELEECRRQHATDLEEIARLRGLNHGLGDARQIHQRQRSEERVVDRIVEKIKEPKP